MNPKKCQSEKKLPVMVFIFGGGFVFGSGELAFYGPEYLLIEKNIVLVTFNYRLDCFGFLSTADKIAAGNWGHDQVLALKWVKENIEYFGGDPARVTIFGGRAGGSSVHLLCFSPLSKGLFRGMISQSGTAYPNPSSYDAKWVANRTKELAEAVVVQQVPLPRWSNACAKCPPDGYPPFPPFANRAWLPVNDFPISDRPFFLCDPNNASCCECSLPWINGFSKNDGSLGPCSLDGIPQFEALVGMLSQPYPYLSTVLGLGAVFPEKSLPAVLEEIRKFYFGDQPISRNKTQAFTNVFTDYIYYWPSVRATLRHPGNVYYYRYDHIAEQGFTDVYGCTTLPEPTHYDDLLTLFEINALFSRTYSATDLKVIKYHVHLWTSFASNGYPPSGKWDEAGTEKNFTYLALGKKPVLKEGLPYPKRYAFWERILQKYVNDDNRK